MLPLLFDEGLPPAVALALGLVGWDAHSVGHGAAPPRQSGDDVNCAWCAEREAVLITNDRGRKDRMIVDELARRHVHAVFVMNDLRARPPHHLLRAILAAEHRMDDIASRRRGLLHHRLRPGGGLDSR